MQNGELKNDNYKKTGELLPSGVSYFVISKTDLLNFLKNNFICLMKFVL